LAVSVALASTPVLAQQSNPDPFDGDFTILSGESAEFAIGVDGNVFNNGTLTLGGEISGDLANQSGGVTNIVDATIVDGQLTNDNVLNIDDTLTLSVGSIENSASGTIDIGDGARLIGVGNTLNNSGATVVGEGGSVEDAGVINNLPSGTITFNGNGTFDSNTDGAGSEPIINDGAIVINSGVGNTVAVGNDRLINQGVGTIAVNSGTLSGITTLANLSSSAAAINVASGATLSFDNLLSSAGTVGVNGTLIGAVNNQTGSTFDLNNVLTGGLTNTGTATVAGSISGATSNNSGGVLTFDGNSTTTGLVTNAGQATVNAGTTLTATGGVSNSGDLAVNGTLDGALTSTGGTVAVDGTVIGALTNQAGSALDLNTTLTGDLTNSGTANVAGSVSGATLNNAGGVLTYDGGASTTASWNNAGQTIVNAGSTVTSVSGVTNSGDLDVNGVFNGVVNSSAGTVDIASGASVNGIVNIDGGSANVSGAAIEVFNDAGTTVNYNGAQISDSGLSLGTVNFDGATSFGDTFTNNGTTTGADGASVTVANTFRGNALTQTGVGETFTITAPSVLLGTGSTVSQGIQVVGTLTNSGLLAFNTGYDVQGGNIINTATGTFNINSAVDFNGFDLSNAGTTNVGAAGVLADVAAIDNTGIFNIASGGNATASSFANQAGAVLNNSGTFTGPIANSGTYQSTGGTLSGQLTNATGANAAFSGASVVDTISNEGTLNVLAGGTLTSANTVQNLAGGVTTLTGDLAASVDNAGTLNFTGGDVTGDVTNTGTVSVSSSAAISGDLNNNGGSTTIDAGNTLTVLGATTNASGADLNVNGTLISSITNAGNLTLGNGLTGNLGSTDGVVVLNGAISGDLDVSGGTFSLSGDSSVTGTNVFTSVGDVAVGQTFTAPETVVDSGGLFTNDGTVNSNVTTLAGGQFALNGTLNGDVINGGIFSAGPSAQLFGNFASSGAINLSLNNTVGDVFTINGDLAGAGSLLTFDIDLQDAVGSVVNSDRIDATGSITGSYLINLNLVNTNFGEQGQDIVLLNSDSDNTGDVSNFSFQLNTATPSGVGGVLENTFIPSGGDFVYSLEVADSGVNSGDLVLVSQLNPGISGLSGNVALSQSLIGSVVNRPSSPFVSGLAAPTDDTCGEGVWTRTVAGRAETTGETSTALSNFPSTITANYYGAQFGLDIGCYQGHFSDWDLSLGVIGGFNDGNATQPVFAINPTDPTQLTNIRLSTTRSTFSQTYVGFYTTAAKGPFAADLQFRAESTEFSLDNPDILLNNSRFRVRGRTLSGAVSYAFRPEKLDGWSLVPTAGFSVTETSTTPILFDDGNSIEVDDHTPKVLFVGGTAAKVNIAENGLSANNYFVTTTFYFDQSDLLTSTFFGDSGPEVLTSNTLGDFGEISAGWSFIRILDDGNGDRAARQFNASVRADARFSDDLTSFGLTGQVRWQF